MGIIDPDIKIERVGTEKLELMSPEDLLRFFKNNLSGLIDDAEIKDYVADMMVRFAHPSVLSVFSDDKTDSLRFDSLLNDPEKHKKYSSLTKIGDAYLWLSGFFPAYLAKTKKSGLGLRNSLQTGQTAYNYAVSVGTQLDSPDPEVGTVSRLGDNFGGLVKAIFELKMRTDIGVLSLSPDVIGEISDTLYGGRPLSVYKHKEKPMLRVV